MNKMKADIESVHADADIGILTLTADTQSAIDVARKDAEDVEGHGRSRWHRWKAGQDERDHFKSAGQTFLIELT